MSQPSPVPTRKDRKRAEIVAIAQDLFFNEGYASTSMSQIAARVGGSKATLYNHFQSKEQLLLAVVEDVVTPDPRDYDAASMPSPSQFREWLAWFGRATVRRITSYKYVSLQRLAAGEALRFPEIGRIFYESGVLPGYTMLREPFLEAMEAGAIRRVDPQVASEHFLELCLGWTVRRVVWNIQPPPTDAEVEKSVSAAVSAFMHGYGLRAQAPAAKQRPQRSRTTRK